MNEKILSSTVAIFFTISIINQLLQQMDHFILFYHPSHQQKREKHSQEVKIVYSAAAQRKTIG